ncbi:MAG: hypothetical protein ACOX62_10585, partial [Christensenellales bacterium]
LWMPLDAIKLYISINSNKRTDLKQPRGRPAAAPVSWREAAWLTGFQVGSDASGSFGCLILFYHP